MKPLDQIKKDGFFPEQDADNPSYLSLLSLRIALKSYFSTYQAMRHFTHMFAADSDSNCHGKKSITPLLMLRNSVTLEMKAEVMDLYG